MYDSIGLLDWRSIISMLEAIAWVVVLGVGLNLLTQTKHLKKQSRQLIFILFTAWAVASISIACINTYSYFHNQRSLFKQSIESQ